MVERFQLWAVLPVAFFAATLAVVFHIIKQPTILNEEINNINKVVNNCMQANTKDIIHQATAVSISFD